MSMSVAIDAMFVDSAHLATMSSATTSTLSSAGRGEGVKTGENEGDFMAINFALSSSLFSDYVLVRTKPFPHLGKYQPLSFKERFRKISVEEMGLRLAEPAFFMFLFLLFNFVKIEKMLEWKSIAGKKIFLPPTLTLILRATFSECHGVRSRETTPVILV